MYAKNNTTTETSTTEPSSLLTSATQYLNDDEGDATGADETSYNILPPYALSRSSIGMFSFN